MKPLLWAITLYLMPALAFAQWDATSNQRSRWEKYFNFDNSLSVGSMGISSLKKRNNNCPTNDLVISIRNYFHLTHNAGFPTYSLNKQIVTDALKEIKIKLNALGEDHKDKCEDDMFATYVMESFWSLLYNYSGYGMSDFSRELGSSRYKLAVGLAATALENMGRIRWLTNEMRTKLGPTWLETENGVFKILGAYDCSETVIYIDPYLNPYDVAGVLIHELDHLFRDKFYANEQQLDVKNFILLDELLAAVQAGFVQKDLDYIPLFIRLDPMTDQKARPTSSFFITEAPTDRTLFMRDGPVDKLWRGVEELGHSNYGPFQFDFFLSETFLRQSDDAYAKYPQRYLDEYQSCFGTNKMQRISGDDTFLPSIKHLSLEYINAPILNTMEKLSRAYFGQGLSEDQKLKLNPQSLWLGLSPLSNWGSGNSNWRAKYPDSPVMEAIGRSNYRSFPPGDINERKQDLIYQRQFIESVLWMAKEIETRAHKTSVTCQRFQDEVRSGNLKEYIGSRVGIANREQGDQTPTSPGTEGVKTLKSFVRPCLHLSDPP